MKEKHTFSAGVPTATTLPAYRKAKLKMLKRDFMIKLTEEEIAHVEELKTEIAIDNFCITMIRTHY